MTGGGNDPVPVTWHQKNQALQAAQAARRQAKLDAGAALNRLETFAVRSQARADRGRTDQAASKDGRDARQQAGKDRSFAALGIFADNDGQVRAILRPGRVLGPLAGAVAHVTAGRMNVGAGIAGAVVLGPAGLFGGSRISYVTIVFADGSCHQKKISGAGTTARAQAEAIRFNALSGYRGEPAPNVTGPVTPLAPAESVSDRLTKLAGLHDAGILTNTEYEEKRTALVSQL
jgi:hypothetical protein